MTQNGALTSNGTAKKGEDLKIVIVGDGGCGKTSLLMVYAKGDFPEVRGTNVFRTNLIKMLDSRRRKFSVTFHCALYFCKSGSVSCSQGCTLTLIWS